MKYKIEDKSKMILCGYNFYGDPFHSKVGWDSENEIGHTWQRYQKSCNNSEMLPYYELHVYNETTATTGHFEVFVGQETNFDSISMVQKVIPSRQSCIVTLIGQEIHSDWYKEFRTMIENQEIVINEDYIIQVYDERFKGMDKIEDSILEVWLPVNNNA
jgi:predicted transcriptional regulator YdeE